MRCCWDRVKWWLAGPLDQTLTNQLLSRTFGMNFDVRRIGERWSAVTSQS